MPVKELLEEIERDISDIKDKVFDYIETKNVPSVHDTSLTFESGEAKYGKIINTCVLFVDIRNSVELNRRHHTQTMGRIYSAFAKSILKIAKFHYGTVRNIIGDRVMVVFPAENCFKNAVNCAVSINHSQGIIRSKFRDVDIKYGIGIDYGELKVIKVGLRRKGTENFDNKNLVWIGYPANIASRLTDYANKTLDTEMVEVNYYPYNFFSGSILGSILGLSQTTDKIFSDFPAKKIHTIEDFGKSIDYNKTLGITYKNGKLISFQKIEKKLKFEPILITEAVFKGLKQNNPERNSIKKNLWRKIENHNIPNVNTTIYEADLKWII